MTPETIREMRGGNVEKLPKWAQSYITRLENANKLAGARLETLNNGREHGPIQMGSVTRSMMLDSIPLSHKYTNREKEFYYPGNDVRVRWAGIELDVLCEGSKLDNKELVLYFHNTTGGLGGKVGIFPGASNTIKLKAIT